MLLDVVNVPSDTPVAKDAETLTDFEPSELCVMVLDFVANNCADVDVVKSCEKLYGVPSIVIFTDGSL